MSRELTQAERWARDVLGEYPEMAFEGEPMVVVDEEPPLRVRSALRVRSVEDTVEDTPLVVGTRVAVTRLAPNPPRSTSNLNSLTTANSNLTVSLHNLAASISNVSVAIKASIEALR